MLTTISGTYEHGHLTLEEAPPTPQKMKVLVTFLEEVAKPSFSNGKRPFGIAKGTIKLADDFDEPLDDLKEYMF